MNTYQSCETNCPVCNKRVWVSPAQIDSNDVLCDVCDITPAAVLAELVRLKRQLKAYIHHADRYVTQNTPSNNPYCEGYNRAKTGSIDTLTKIHNGTEKRF